MAEDKQWAQKYILGPLTAPEPSQEDGPGSHFIRNPNPESRNSSTSDSKRSSRASSTYKVPSVRVTKSPPSYQESTSKYPTPPASASPTRSSFHPSNPYSSHRHSAFIESSSTGSHQRSPTLEEPPHGKGRRRHSSLGERYTGDMSHRPLDQIRKETKKADRAPHLKKTHIPGADVIDTLDNCMLVGGAYHHEGPYDATLISRNINIKNSPVAATQGTNAEALRATPRENIEDSLQKHIPLQGTAVIPPGMTGMDGKPMQYEEGADLMREADAEGGAYKRWPGVKYLPEDYKGKGEPSFTIERALKGQKRSDHRRVASDGNSAYEMQTPRTRPSGTRSTSDDDHLAVPGASSSGADSRNNMSYSQYEREMRRSNTTGNKIGEGLKKRFGSLRRHKKTTEA